MWGGGGGNFRKELYHRKLKAKPVAYNFPAHRNYCSKGQSQQVVQNYYFGLT